MTGTIAITMAGMGSRFRQAGYTQPKYEIMACRKPLFDWSMASLEAFRQTGWDFVFATREAEHAIPFLEERCAALEIDLRDVVELDHLTDGQATTALYLAQRARQEEPFLVFNIDTYVKPHAMNPDCIEDGVDGWVPCFPGPGDGWSFVRVDENLHALELREKVRISDHATTGLYWFSSAQLYQEVYGQHFKNNAPLEKGERYIAPMYNTMIQNGRRVTISILDLDDVGMLGTPEQVQTFIRTSSEKMNPSLSKTTA